MKTRTIFLWESDEYNYPMACGFIPNIFSYIHDEDNSKRTCMIVVPGGAYRTVSLTEGELVALKFYEKGYKTFVCSYTTNFLMMKPLKNQPMKDLSRSIRFLRKNADEFNINPEKIVICGFSAGGHLSASVCVHFEDIIDMNPQYVGISNRPNASILSYPVISAGEKAHNPSFIALLGAEASEEDKAYMSLENQFKENTPPCFIWHTATDEAVPVENSYLFASACLRKGGYSRTAHFF